MMNQPTTQSQAPEDMKIITVRDPITKAVYQLQLLECCAPDCNAITYAPARWPRYVPYGRMKLGLITGWKVGRKTAFCESCGSNNIPVD